MQEMEEKEDDQWDCDTNVWAEKGARLTRMGQHEEALACCYSRASEIEPTSLAVWALKGISLAGLDCYRPWRGDRCIFGFCVARAGPTGTYNSVVFPPGTNCHPCLSRRPSSRNIKMDA